MSKLNNTESLSKNENQKCSKTRDNCAKELINGYVSNYSQILGFHFSLRSNFSLCCIESFYLSRTVSFSIDFMIKSSLQFKICFLLKHLQSIKKQKRTKHFTSFKRY